jgi:hypothetical protein
LVENLGDYAIFATDRRAGSQAGTRGPSGSSEGEITGRFRRFDTDYLLVKAADLPTAVAALRTAGHTGDGVTT